MNKEKIFYDKLKESLKETTEFPAQYMFKFIILSVPERIQEVERIFDNMGAVITSKPSKNGKYTSLTILVKMNTAEDIIKKYKEVSGVEGIISL
jgi:putative lipoic acid-binding regulatory protein